MGKNHGLKKCSHGSYKVTRIAYNNSKFSLLEFYDNCHDSFLTYPDWIFSLYYWKLFTFFCAIHSLYVC